MSGSRFIRDLTGLKDNHAGKFCDMSGFGSALSIANFMIKSAQTLAIQWPTSWMIDQLTPPPPDISSLDIEAKLRILRGEQPDWIPNESINWWSPASWMDKTEEWMKNWIDTSKSWADTACEIKKNWDDLVAAKQAEREQTRLVEIEELTEEEEDEDDQEIQHHLVPDVVVTGPDSEGNKLLLNSSHPRVELLTKLSKSTNAKEEGVTDEQDYKFQQNSAQNYAELSKKIAERVSLEKNDNQQRQNWRNKEIKKGKNEIEPKIKNLEKRKDANNDIVSFSKTYSFRNLPKGKVAKFKQQFEANPDENALLMKQTALTTPLPHLGKVKKGPSPRSPLRNIIEEKTKPLVVPIKSWEDDRHNWPSSVLDQSLKKPRSRQGFHASTPALTSTIDDTINRELSQSSTEIPQDQFNSIYIKEYLEALKEKRDKARHHQTTSKTNDDVTTVKQLLIEELADLQNAKDNKDSSGLEECKPTFSDILTHFDSTTTMPTNEMVESDHLSQPSPLKPIEETEPEVLLMKISNKASFSKKKGAIEQNQPELSLESLSNLAEEESPKVGEIVKERKTVRRFPNIFESQEKISETNLKDNAITTAKELLNVSIENEEEDLLTFREKIEIFDLKSKNLGNRRAYSNITPPKKSDHLSCHDASNTLKLEQKEIQQVQCVKAIEASIGQQEIVKISLVKMVPLKVHVIRNIPMDLLKSSPDSIKLVNIVKEIPIQENTKVEIKEENIFKFSSSKHESFDTQANYSFMSPSEITQKECSNDGSEIIALHVNEYQEDKFGIELSQKPILEDIDSNLQTKGLDNILLKDENVFCDSLQSHRNVNEDANLVQKDEVSPSNNLNFVNELSIMTKTNDPIMTNDDYEASMTAIDFQETIQEKNGTHVYKAISEKEASNEVTYEEKGEKKEALEKEHFEENSKSNSDEANFQFNGAFEDGVFGITSMTTEEGNAKLHIISKATTFKKDAESIFEETESFWEKSYIKIDNDEGKSIITEIGIIAEEAEAALEKIEAKIEKVKILSDKKDAIPEAIKTIPDENDLVCQVAKTIPENAEILTGDKGALSYDTVAFSTDTEFLTENGEIIIKETDSANELAIFGESKILTKEKVIFYDEDMAMPEKVEFLIEDRDATSKYTEAMYAFVETEESGTAKKHKEVGSVSGKVEPGRYCSKSSNEKVCTETIEDKDSSVEIETKAEEPVKLFAEDIGCTKRSAEEIKTHLGLVVINEPELTFNCQHSENAEFVPSEHHTNEAGILSEENTRADELINDSLVIAGDPFSAIATELTKLLDESNLSVNQDNGTLSQASRENYISETQISLVDPRKIDETPPNPQKDIYSSIVSGSIQTNLQNDELELMKVKEVSIRKDDQSSFLNCTVDQAQDELSDSLPDLICFEIANQQEQFLRNEENFAEESHHGYDDCVFDSKDVKEPHHEEIVSMNTGDEPFNQYSLNEHHDSGIHRQEQEDDEDVKIVVGIVTFEEENSKIASCLNEVASGKIEEPETLNNPRPLNEQYSLKCDSLSEESHFSDKQAFYVAKPLQPISRTKHIIPQVDDIEEYPLIKGSVGESDQSTQYELTSSSQEALAAMNLIKSLKIIKERASQTLDLLEALSKIASKYQAKSVNAWKTFFHNEHLVEDSLVLGLKLTTGLSLVGLMVVALHVLQEICFKK